MGHIEARVSNRCFGRLVSFVGTATELVQREVRPFGRVDVKVVYDMPKDAVPASIELHDSRFSDGVKGNL